MVQVVKLVLSCGLLAAVSAVGAIALTPVTPTPPTVIEGKTNDVKPQESTVPDSGDTTAAVQWNAFEKEAKTLDDSIMNALSKRQLAEAVATEFRSDLNKIHAHIQAVKPKTKDIGFSQRLLIARDLSDIKAEFDYAVASFMHPHESVETVKSKFLAELDDAEKAKKIAPGDVEKLRAEVKEQEDLMKSMRRGAESLAAKDQELIANNFAVLHVALQRRIAFSQDAVPQLIAERKKVQEMLQNAESANTLDKTKANKFNDSLTKIAIKESEALAKGPLSSSQIVGLAMEIEGLDDIVQNQINTTHDSK